LAIEIRIRNLVRTRLGGYFVDLKYVAEKVFLIEKVGEDNFFGVLTSARFLRDNGIKIPVTRTGRFCFEFGKNQWRKKGFLPDDTPAILFKLQVHSKSPQNR
jgi:hypothetical protein